jgi:WD40 repeat protein
MGSRERRGVEEDRGSGGTRDAALISPEGDRLLSNRCRRESQALGLGERRGAEGLQREDGTETADIRAAALSPADASSRRGSARSCSCGNLESGKKLRSFAGHEDFIHTIAIASGGARIVPGSFDHTIRIGDASNGKAVRAFRSQERSEARMNALALSPDSGTS